MKDNEWVFVFLLCGGCLFFGGKFLPDSAKQAEIEVLKGRVVQLESELKGMERGLGLVR